MEKMEVLPLHNHRDLTDACAEILNVHWPRSKAARNHGLSKSCDQMPVCLAFVRQDGSNVEVLGFVKILTVQGVQNSCLLESVIVREIDRGKGLGRVLMSLTEHYAQGLGIKTVYLNTLDKEGFYERVGYTKCSPVTSLGENAHRVPEAMLKKLLGVSISLPHLKEEPNIDGRSCHSTAREPEILDNKNDNSASQLSIKSNVRYKEQLSLTTSPAPPPPPPLPLPTKSLSSDDSSSYSRAVVRMDPNCVIWMKKDL